jgi:hypothetical protein
MPDQAYAGLLTMRSSGGDVVAIWQAAPNNVFQIASLTLTPQILNATTPS